MKSFVDIIEFTLHEIRISIQIDYRQKVMQPTDNIDVI